MTQTQRTAIRVKAAHKAHRTMDGYTGKDAKELANTRHLAAVKAWATRRAAAKGKKAPAVKKPA